MKTKHGFTLIELMVTIAVAIVIMAVGIPVFSTMIANNRAAADSNALVTALQFARSEAVKRSDSVRVCAGNGTNSAPTPTACSGDNNWARGLLVLAPGNEVLRVWDLFKGDDDDASKDRVDIVEIASSATEVTFASDGSLVGGGRFCLQMDRSAAVGAQAQRWLGVNTTGRTQVSSTKADVPPCNP